jgi:hemin uptake protein HemP
VVQGSSFGCYQNVGRRQPCNPPAKDFTYQTSTAPHANPEARQPWQANVPSNRNIPRARITTMRPTSRVSEASRPPPAVAPRSITSSELMQDARVLIIHHANEQYRLQVTVAGKLILTK